MARICPICDSEAPQDASCPTCGAPADVSARSQSGGRADCPTCGGVIWSLAESCPHCDARGYPALRPRFGGKSLRAPETEEPGGGRT